MRVLTGLVAFYTILTYTPDLVLLFGPDGLLPVEGIRRLRGDLTSFSYLNWLDTPGQLWAAHFAGLAAIALFTVGLFTRVTAIVSLVVVLSYVHRAPILTAEMEPVLAFVMLYLCLGPSGAYLSLDHLWSRRETAGASVRTPPAEQTTSWAATVAVRLIQVHLTIVFVMMVLAQLNENTWWDGTAMWWLAGRRQSVMLDLTWLHEHPWLVNAWTHCFVFYEAAFVMLAWNRLAAPLVVVLGCFAWGLFALLTGLASLAVMMIVASLAFLPASSLRTLAGCCGLSALVK